MKRPNIPAHVRVNVAINQAEYGEIRCPLCHTGLASMDERVLEHMVPHELGGASDETNLRWVHKDCALSKTNGTKATSASGDLHKIAKAKRLERAHAAHEAAVLGKVVNPPIVIGIKDNGSPIFLDEASIAYRKKGRRIPSHPFPKRVKP